MKNTLAAMAAGALGGFIMCLAIWLATHYGLLKLLNVAISGSLDPVWIYPRIVWSGLWGLLLVLPLFSSNLLTRSFVLALIPSVVQLFIIYPYYQGQGVAGFKLGILTPFVVFLFNWVWSLASLVIVKLAK